MEIFGRQFEILQPAWLAGLALLPLVVFYCRWSLAGLSRGRRALLLSARVLLLVALLLALCQLKVTWLSGRQMVVFALDQSASIPQSSRHEAETFLEQAGWQAHGSRVAYLPFAASAGPVQAELPRGPIKLDRQGTNLAAAVIAARTQIPADYVPRIVLLTDGNQTEGDVLRAVRSCRCADRRRAAGFRGRAGGLRGGRADAGPGPGRRTLCRRRAGALRPRRRGHGAVVRLLWCGRPACPGKCRRPACPGSAGVPPARGSAGVPPARGSAGVSPARQNAGETPAPQRTATPVGRRKVKVVPGDNRIPFTCTVRGQRSAVLTARIDGFRDTIAENNSATAMVFSTGRPKALVLAHDPSSVQHLGPVLTGERIDFDFRPTLAPASAPACHGRWKSCRTTTC